MAKSPGSPIYSLNLVSMLCCFVGNDWHSGTFKHDATGFSTAELFLRHKFEGPGELAHKWRYEGRISKLDQEEYYFKAREIGRQGIANNIPNIKSEK